MRNIREAAEKKELRDLSKYAALSVKSRGRRKKERECSIRTVYQHDRDRIIHSKAFRRLKHKTQVFISPACDHYRTRLTHTLEVSQIARTVARALGLNEDLAEAVALGHDLGHTPFGHAGESVLNDILKQYGMSFDHNEQSLHVIDNIEKLNLTDEVRNGILNHPWTYPAARTLEGQIVRFADRVAYINHDIQDSIASGVLKKEQIPVRYRKFIGKSTIDAFVKDLINNSAGKPKICLSKKGLETLTGLYRFMFRTVYMGPESVKQEIKVESTIKSLFTYYMAHPEKMPGYKKKKGKKELVKSVRDFIAGMTDRYAINTYNSIFVPSEWKV